MTVAAVHRGGLPAAVPRAFEQAGDDAALLTAAVALEWVAAGTYRALARVEALGPATRRTFDRLAVQESDHAGLLASALSALGGGARAPAPPSDGAALERARRKAGLRRPITAVRGEAGVVAAALELEDALIASYHIMLMRLRDLRLVTVATQIMGAEAQHAVVVRGLVTDDPAVLVPSAFEDGGEKIR